ncbi:MAG: cyclic nucleotide-binding domain-containing protein [Pseudomonadota bacterium]
MKFLWSSHPFRKGKEREQVLEALENNVLFDSLTSRELSIIEELVHVRKYNVGEDIFKQHQPGVGMYIIVKGKVCIEVERKVLDPKTEIEKKEVAVLATLNDGDFFGERALIETDSIRSATAKAMEPSFVVGFFKPDLLELIKDRPSIGVKISYKLAQIINQRLDDAAEELSRLRFHK